MPRPWIIIHIVLWNEQISINQSGSGIVDFFCRFPHDAVFAGDPQAVRVRDFKAYIHGICNISRYLWFGVFRNHFDRSFQAILNNSNIDQKTVICR